MRVGTWLLAIIAVCFVTRSAFAVDCTGVPSRITGPLVNVKPGTTILCSPDGRYALVFTPAGNLNIFDNQAKRPTWSSGTAGTGQTFAFQGDGNLVVYGASGAAFVTNTMYPYPNPPFQFSLQLQGTDGNLVLLQPAELAPGGVMPLWSTQTGPTGNKPPRPVMTLEQLAVFIQQMDALNRCPRKISKIIFVDNKDKYEYNGKPPAPTITYGNALNFVAMASQQTDGETYVVQIGEIDFGKYEINGVQTSRIKPEDLLAAMRLSKCFRPPPVNVTAVFIDHGSAGNQNFGNGELTEASQAFFQMLGHDFGVTTAQLQGCQITSNGTAFIQQVADWIGGTATGDTGYVMNGIPETGLFANDVNLINSIAYSVDLIGNSKLDGGTTLTAVSAPNAQAGKNYATTAACGVTSVAWSKSDNGRSRYCVKNGPGYVGFNGAAQSACFAACGNQAQSPGGCVASCQDNFHAFCVGAWSCTGDTPPPPTPTPIPDWSGSCRVSTTCYRDKWPHECSASYNVAVPNGAACVDWPNRLDADINLQYQMAMQCKAICGAEYMFWGKEGNSSTLWIRK